ncbi:MAG: hypothetical protein ACR2FO_05360 [Actinomycetota bacterium]
MSRYRHPLVLLVTGYFLLMVAWALSQPPGVAPDEFHHYLKAVAAQAPLLI